MKLPRNSSLLIAFIFFSTIHFSFGQTNVFDSLEVDGITRIYRLYIPASYTGNEEVPLVLNLHGYGSNSLEQFLYGNFTAIADTANFIIAMPEGTTDLVGNLSWNTFGLSAVDDVGFLSQFIDFVSSQYNIDQERIYSTGMSNGGFMSYELACQLGNKITAIASVTGSMNVLRIADCNPGRVFPVMQIHGTMDATVPYNGNIAFAPIDSVVSFWRANNTCISNANFENVPDINTTDNCTAEHYVWDCSLSNSSVEFFKIIGGGHSWPGALININTTNMDFSASAEIWRFFSQYKLSDFITLGFAEAKDEEAIKVYPNPSDGQFKLAFEDAQERQVEIMDVSGRTIYFKTILNSSETIDIQESGLYMYRIAEQGKTYSGKIIIQ